MAREGFTLGAFPEIFADVQFAAVIPPVVVRTVVFPPCVHPRRPDRPTAAEIGILYRYLELSQHRIVYLS